jgi:pimeloyl-ACP methyl ester carboxylesterase
MDINGVEICVETFGDRADPAVLLIMGSGASMDFWEDGFCERLQAGGRFVIRYDHRDTGQSISYPPGAPGYSGDDLIADAAAVITALGLDRAHVVGMSMGGAIAQLLTLGRPELVASLTLISTSAGFGDDDLPGIADRLSAAFAVPRPDIDDREALLDYLTELSRAHSSDTEPFDAAETRALWVRALDRTRNAESMLTNHDLLDGGEAWRHRLSEIQAPTLVIHGKDDPLFAPAHGIALAREIPGAELLLLDGMGHELPPRTWDAVVPAIVRRSSAAPTQPGRS